MSQRPLLAAVALERAELPGAEVVLELLRRRWPELEASVRPAEREGVVTLALGDDLAGLALSTEPLPWKEMAGPCAAAWYWPAAGRAFRTAAAHLLAAVLAGGRDRQQSALRLTALVAAAAEAAPALGIYWGPGRLVHAPVDFLRESRQMAPGNLPLNLWVDFRLQPEDDGACSLFTTGLAAFGHRELEIWQSRRPPRELRDCAYNVAHYLLEKGAVLREGESVGVSETERIPVSIEASRWDPALRVTRLDV